MKKYIAAILVVLILLTACENKIQTGTVTIKVRDESNSRTVSPDKADTAIAKYVVQGLSGIKSFKNEFTSPEFTLSLDEGDWSINIDAYGSDDKLVAKTDSQTISVIRYKNTTAVFQLNSIFDGTGTFNFKLGIPKDATAMNKILCSLSSADGTLSEVDFEFDFIADATIDGDYSIFTKTLTVPAGSYNLKVETTNVFDTVYGIPINDSVIVQTEQKTDYEHIWDMAFFPKTTNSFSNNWTKWGIRQTYEVLSIGPTGGYIVYDCDADNTEDDPDGPDNLLSTECGWRYLEAAPSDLSSTYIFGYYRGSSSSSNTTVGTSKEIGTGKTNTKALVKAMGNTTYSSDSGTSTAVYAAKACDSYSKEVNGVVYDDWFLPSKDELKLLYTILCSLTTPLGNFITSVYWSSSEYSSYGAWSQSFNDGSQSYNYGRSNRYYVRPIRAF